MQRLVYAPRVQAWIKADEGVVDVSDYITTCDVRRKVNQVSQADLTLRNPKMIFTEHKRSDGSIGPLFHPMDPIIIAMTRLRGKPIQVFTGYCDKTPYLQLFPGVCRLETSCTLKRLQYTFWDPGLPFIIDFLQQYGWVPKGKGTIVSPEGASKSLEQTNQFNDGSIANLLFAVLKNIGGWNEKNIFIENLPPGVLPIVSALFDNAIPDNSASTKELEDFLTKIIGTAALGNSSTAGNDSLGPAGPEGTLGGPFTKGQKIFGPRLASLSGLDLQVIGAWMLAEESSGPAQQREAQGNHNWLNIGYFDSGAGKIAHDAAFKTPQSGAEFSFRFLKGTWGGASQGIRNILKSAGKSKDAQISAIANSGWASSGYNGGSGLRSLMGQVHVSKAKDTASDSAAAPDHTSG